MRVVEKGGGCGEGGKAKRSPVSHGARAKLLAAGEVGQGRTVAENCEARRRDGGGGETRRGESARGAVAEIMSRAAEAWAVVGGDGGEEREGGRERARERWREEREGGRARASKRGTRASVCCVELQGSPWCWRLRLLRPLLLEGCAPKKKVRRVRAERALAPSRRLPLACLLACNVCTCIYYYIDIDADYIYPYITSYIGCCCIYIYCQSGNRVVSYILSGVLSPRCHQDPAASPNQYHALGQT